jgi:hypothetical protein
MKRLQLRRQGPPTGPNFSGCRASPPYWPALPARRSPPATIRPQFFGVKFGQSF